MLLVLMITSKGIAGVPRASLVVIAATLSLFNIPEAGLLLILARRPFPRHGPLGDQRRRQCGGERGGGALGRRARSARAAPRSSRRTRPAHRPTAAARRPRPCWRSAGSSCCRPGRSSSASSSPGLALNIVPGADMTFVIASAARGGRRDGIVAALGIGAGTLVHISRRRSACRRSSPRRRRRST